jgi:ankyrin repeat protein
LQFHTLVCIPPLPTVISVSPSPLSMGLSTLDDVLPLHAALSGGNDFVEKLLIEQGANVNASR